MIEERDERVQIMLDVPEDILKALGGKPENVSRAVLELLAIDGYRSRLLSETQVRRLLGFETRYQVHGFPKDHGVELDCSEDSLSRDLEFVDGFKEWSSSQTPRR
jgi:hypothetical protein